MLELRELLRMHYEARLSNRQIAQALGTNHVTIGDCIRRFTTSGGIWPLAPDTTEAQLRALLYPGNAGRPRSRPEPDWVQIHADLRRHRLLTLQQVWVEYKEVYPDGLQYTQFCDRYRQFTRSIDVRFRRFYRPGDQMQVDFAGDLLPIYSATGEVQHRGALFVAVLPYSNFVFVGVYPDQTLASWIRGHVEAFAAFQGAPRIIVPDNPKPLVTDTRGDLVLNSTYQALGEHYRCALIPARVRRPRDKPKAEGHVLIVERWILMALRHVRITSLAEAQEHVRALTARLNDRPFQKWPGTRRTWWEEERVTLQPLPATPFTYVSIRQATVGPDYHVRVDNSAYSVPFTLVGRIVEVRLTAQTVECLYDGERVASHPRALRANFWSTHREHMPPNHQAARDGWSRDRFVRRARQIGPTTTELIETLFDRARIPEQMYTRCQGILRLAKEFSPAVMEAATRRAIQAEMWTVKGIRLFCEKEQSATQTPPVTRTGHENTRGAAYFAAGAQTPEVNPNVE